MEADWEIEIGGEAPIIDAYWSGLVDLRAAPAKVSKLAECGRLPGLADALIRLNSAGSPVWTSKTDVFEADNVDPFEVDGVDCCDGSGVSCYIDLLPREERWRNHSDAVRDCEQICDRLHAIELRGCRVDLIIRRAHFSASAEGFGVTAYLTGCYMDLDKTTTTLSACLKALVGALMPGP
jgi:hypothetical protein